MMDAGVEMREIEVFQQFKPELSNAVCDSVLVVAIKCQSCGLINETADDIVHNRVDTPLVKARLLLNAVEQCIKIDSENLKKFMDILDEELPASCKKPLTEMRQALEILCTDDSVPNGQSVVVVLPKPSYEPFTKGRVQKPNSIKSKKRGSDGVDGISCTLSTDSGISVEHCNSVHSELDESSAVGMNSTSTIVEEQDMVPIEEGTPLEGKPYTVTSPTASKDVKTEDHTISNELLYLEGSIRNVRFEVQQKEALELHQQKRIEQLQNELDFNLEGKKRQKKNFI